MMGKFSERLNEALQIREISAAELSRRANIPAAVISQYRSGRYEPKQDRVDLIAEVLNVSAVWLMGYDVPISQKVTSASLGSNIKRLRLERGLTQEQLAKSLNTTPQAVYKYEQGIVTNIPIDKIQLMASIFHVTPSEIMGWEQPEPEKPIDDNDLKFALFGGDAPTMSDKALEDVKNFAEFVREREKTRNQKNE